MMRVAKIMAMIMISCYTYGQDITYTLTGHSDEVVGNDTFHVAQVLAYSNSSFKLGSGQLYINYDTTAFGANAFATGAAEIVVDSSCILSRKVGAGLFEFDFYGSFVVNDNTFSRFSFSWQHDFSADCITDENMHPYSDLLFTIRMKYKPGFSDYGHGLCLEGGQNYISQTFTACGPSPCSTEDCLNFPGTQINNDNYPCNDCRIVYTSDDLGEGSLRDAIACATTGDTIRFANVLAGDTILLTSAELIIDKEIFLLANPEYEVHVSGQGVARVFDVLQNDTLVVHNLSMSAGQANGGNAIINSGHLVLRDLEIYSADQSPTDSLLLNYGTLAVQGLVKLKE